MERALISVENVSKSFADHKDRVQVLKGISLEADTGELVAVEGPSGSGKTSLLNLIGAVLAADEGRVCVDGQDVGRMSDRDRCRLRNRYFGYVVQDFALIEGETALQNILVPACYSKDRTTAGQYRERAQALAERLGIGDRLKVKVSKLSGGERQRVAIARSQICGQKIILADEPTGALDEENSLLVMNFFRELVQKERKTVILVTHNRRLLGYCDRVYRLERGRLVG